MMEYKDREYKTTELRIGRAIVRIHDPNITEEQKIAFRRRLEAATIMFLQKVEKQRRHKSTGDYACSDECKYGN